MRLPAEYSPTGFDPVSLFANRVRVKRTDPPEYDEDGEVIWVTTDGAIEPVVILGVVSVEADEDGRVAAVVASRRTGLIWESRLDHLRLPWSER